MKEITLNSYSKNYFSSFIYLPDLIYNCNHSLHIIIYCAFLKRKKPYHKCFLHFYLAYLMIVFNGCIVVSFIDIL